MTARTASSYLETLSDNPSGQRALLACATALRLDDEAAMQAIAVVSGDEDQSRELIYLVKNLSCVWQQWDGTWYLAEDVRRGLIPEVYARFSESQISRLRNALARSAEAKAARMQRDGQITSYRRRDALIEAGYQRTLVRGQADAGSKKLGEVWEKAQPDAGEATARSVDYLADEIEDRLGELPVEVLFLRGMAARTRGDAAQQHKYFRRVWLKGRVGRIFGTAAHFYGLLERDASIAERALRDSVKWNTDRRHKGQAYHSLGNLVGRDNRRRKEAEGAYHAALKLLRDPASEGQVWHSLANLLAESRDARRQAETAYRTSLELLPDPASKAQVWHSLANLLSKDSSRWEEAESAFYESLQLAPDRESEVQVETSLASLLIRYRDRHADRRAEKILLRSLERAGSNPLTQSMCNSLLAVIYQRRGNIKAALKALELKARSDRLQRGWDFLRETKKRIASLRRRSGKRRKPSGD
jgi:tetratricopeptide (TPR) repeat protein